MDLKKRLKDLQKKIDANIMTETSELSFGKYKGYTVARVLDCDPSYILWLKNQLDKKFSVAVITDATEAVAYENERLGEIAAEYHSEFF